GGRVAGALDFGGEHGDAALGSAPDQGFVAGGLRGRGGGALARVERMTERLPVIAPSGRLVIADQQLFGGRQLFGREGRRARGAGRLDGADGLVVFLFGRRAARRPRGD